MGAEDRLEDLIISLPDIWVLCLKRNTRKRLSKETNYLGKEKELEIGVTVWNQIMENRQKEKCPNLKSCGTACGGQQWKPSDLSHSEENLGEYMVRNNFMLAKGE